MKRRFSLLCLVLIFLVLVLNVVQPVKASSNAWSETWHSGIYDNYPGYPQNISTTKTVYSTDGHYWVKIALVVSIYQYAPYYDYDMVAFRAAVYFDSFAYPGLPSPWPVAAQRVTFLLYKDTSGSNWYDQKLSVEQDNDPGFSQACGLSQLSSISSTYDQKASWALSTLGFAVGLFCEPLGIAIDLIDMALSYDPQGADFDNVEWSEISGGAIWWHNTGYDFGDENPVKQYAFSSIRWFQNPNINPSTYYGIIIGASIDLPWPNPLGVSNILMPYTYLRINRDSGGGGPGGCPNVYAWDGSAYMQDNNVLAASEVSNGADVEDFYRLEQRMAPLYTGPYFSTYSLMLGEFEHEHSYIDKVRLYAVDHDSNVNIGITPEGQILTYTNPHPPISAVDNYASDWLPFVTESDYAYYKGFPGDYLLLDFGSLDISQGAKLVLRANMEFKKDTCIHVQVLNEADEWTDVVALRTRYHWSTLIVDLAGYLPNPDGSLKIRLYLTGIHKVDYVGLDTSSQADTTTIRTCAIQAIHSTSGDVTLKLLLNDQTYAELTPAQQITLKFILPNTQKARTFILYIEGHYYKIQ